MSASVNVLNLTQYRVLQVDETEHDYHVYTEVRSDSHRCPRCQSEAVSRWGTRELLFRDLPMHGKRVGIYVGARQLRCGHCERTFPEQLPALSESRQMTRRLLTWIGQQSLKRSFTSIADEVGVDEGTIRNIFRDYIKELEAQFEVETPRWLGIDEIHIVKPRCVIANIESKTIVNILPDRNRKTVAGYLHALPQRQRIKLVAMDMWVPYRDAVKAVLPQATIIVDKFHVLRMANAAIEQVRKSLRASLSAKQRRGLMHDRFILLKRAHDLTMQERFLLDSWISLHPALGEAYRLKEELFAIYDARDKASAATRYHAWEASIPETLKPAFAPIMTAWGNWHREILTYFDQPVTNAYTESLNNLIRVMNRIGRGYSFEALRAKILFTEGPQKSKRPKFERRGRGDGFVALRAISASFLDALAWEDKSGVSLGVDIPALTKMIAEGRFPGRT